MENNDAFIRVVQDAISGDEASQGQLVKDVTVRIRTYVYRSTLDQTATDDILQEVFCKMFESLGNLRNVNSFWPWMYRIASNCINTHYRSRSKTSKQVNLQDEVLDSIVGNKKTSEAYLMKKELGDAVIAAIATLKPRHRQMVTLRCFESMSFKEIGHIEETTEIYSRVLFYRAIEKLRIALKKQGFTKASLLIALTLFGKLTASSEAASAATTVTAASVSGGGGSAIGSLISAKIATAAASMSVHQIKVAIAIGIAVTAAVTASTVGTLRSNVKSIHFVVQGVRPVEKQPVAASISSSSSSSSSFNINRENVEYRTMGAYEDKIVMPDGPNGAMLRFSQRWDIKMTGKLCSWLQDGSGNYYYASDKKKIFINNEPLRMSVLPTDPPDFVEFVRSQVGYDSRISKKHKFFSKLLKSSVDNRVSKHPDYKSEYKYNTLQLADLTSTWPKNVDIVDTRDEMHKRGWTSFEIDGLIDGKPVTGVGQIPFVYNMYADHKPWISISAGDDVYIDYPDKFAGADCDEGILTFENESFFEGFCRPWQGIPCVDSVMRDAAKRRLRYTVRHGNNAAEVTVFVNTSKGQLKIVYGIDREADVISSIRFLKGDEVFGQLYFNYMQDTANAQHEKFTPPQTKISDKKGVRPDTPWLAMLANNI